jgi:hypothetical protein
LYYGNEHISTTAAGIFIDTAFYEKIKNEVLPGQLSENTINYVEFMDRREENTETLPIIPTVIGVKNIEPEIGRIQDGKSS